MDEKKIQIQLDDEGYWTGNYAKVGNLPQSVEAQEIPLEKDNIKKRCYKYVGGELLYDKFRYQEYLKKQEELEEQNEILSTKENLENQIFELKSNLSETDYKVNKCMESYLIGEELPYDINSVHLQRQAWRDEINRLELEIENLNL